MSKTRAWISAMRLRTLPLSLSGIILGSSVAHFNGYWNITIFTLALVTTIFFQVLSNFANDLGDGLKGTDNEDRIGPKRAVQSGEISPKNMKIAVIFTSILSFISAGLLIYFSVQNMNLATVWFYIGLTIASVIAAISYTIGRNAYGYHGLGDLMVLFFFGGVSVLGVYSLYAPHFISENILLSIFVGLLSVAVLNLNNMRDFENDLKAKKNTLVVKMGPNSAKIYHALLVITAISSLTIFIQKIEEPLLNLALLPCIVLLLHLKKVMSTKNPEEFDPELKKVALATFALSLFTSIGLFLL